MGEQGAGRRAGNPILGVIGRGSRRLVFTGRAIELQQTVRSSSPRSPRQLPMPGYVVRNRTICGIGVECGSEGTGLADSDTRRDPTRQESESGNDDSQ